MMLATNVPCSAGALIAHRCCGGAVTSGEGVGVRVGAGVGVADGAQVGGGDAVAWTAAALGSGVHRFDELGGVGVGTSELAVGHRGEVAPVWPATVASSGSGRVTT